MDRSVLSRAARVLALVATAAVGLSGGVKELFPTAIFTFEKHPDLPLRSYAEGKLGVVQPTYARSYLYVAFRWMNGAPMTAEEVDQLDAYWQERLAANKPPSGAAKAYDAVRGALDLPWQAPEKPNGYAASQSLAVDYVYYSKCSDDAFASAAKTLEARIEQFGKQSREVAEWVLGQDYVFENCFGAGSGFIPPRAPSDIDPLIQADRNYQIAAALFYSSRYQDAAAAFRRIAVDSRSPWAGWGSYLAGRAMLWYARMGGERSGSYRGRLAQAEAELRAAAEGQGPQEARDAARWLLVRILMRTNPSEAATMLSGRLLSPLGAAARGRELHLFTQLLDNLAGDAAALARIRSEVELVDWIFTFQQEDEAAAAHAVERWREGRSVAWLAAALSKVGPFEQAAPELLAAAAQVQGHPAKPTLAYYQARLHIERGEQQQAVEVLDRLLPQLRGLASSRNRALSMRATLGRGPQEILFFGARPPAFVSYIFWKDAYISPWRLAPDERAKLGAFQNTMFWGPETAEILNGAVTVDALVNMLRVDGQPQRLFTELLLAAWTRALLLERWDLVRAMAERVGDEAPSMREDMQALLQVTEMDRMRYFAARGLLKTPGASLLLHSGPIRVAPLDQVDPKGLNWWVEPPVSEVADYLPSEEKRYVAAEWNRIRAAGGGYAWLVRQAIAEAERETPDPSAPETLYRAAVALDGVDLKWGYYRLAGEASELRSRAVETLRRRFPDSEWTAKAAMATETANVR